MKNCYCAPPATNSTRHRPSDPPGLIDEVDYDYVLPLLRPSGAFETLMAFD